MSISNIFDMEKGITKNMLKKKLKLLRKMFKNLAYWLETQVNHEKFSKNWENF